MDKMLVRAHPLEGRLITINGVSLSPLEACERISLRAESKALAGLGREIGVVLPRKHGIAAIKNHICALKIGPDEWFLMAPCGTGLEAKINKITTSLYSAVPIDHRNTGLRLSGSNAVHALNAGCPRDLSLDAFPVGHCARTVLAKAEIILWRTDENVFRVECWRSFSDYVWKYLVEVARSV